MCIMKMDGTDVMLKLLIENRSVTAMRQGVRHITAGKIVGD